MTDNKKIIGIVLHAPTKTHSELKEACSRHQRSIQKTLLALVEQWLANGAPDPFVDGSTHAGITSRVAKLEYLVAKMEEEGW
jgi:hypothetical protein